MVHQCPADLTQPGCVHFPSPRLTDVVGLHQLRETDVPSLYVVIVGRSGLREVISLTSAASRVPVSGCKWLWSSVHRGPVAPYTRKSRNRTVDLGDVEEKCVTGQEHVTFQVTLGLGWGSVWISTLTGLINTETSQVYDKSTVCPKTKSGINYESFLHH